MRVEQVIAGYRQERNRRGTDHDRWRNGRVTSVPHTTRAIVLDSLELSGEPRSIRGRYQWLAAFVKRMPEELVREKIRQLFTAEPTKQDFLVSKLIFELF